MNKNQPLVSIIIPVFNVEDYLEDCLSSVLNQTYKSIEVIAVDDGSTDKSLEILKEFCQKHENFYLISNPLNQGQAVARNLGVVQSKGKYLLYVDSDDYIELDTVAHLVHTIEKYDVDFVRFNAQSFSEEGETIRQKEYNFNLYLQEQAIYEKKHFKNVYLSFPPSPVLYLFKRTLVEEHNIRFQKIIIHEDELYSSHIFLHAQSCVYIDQSFYHRRYRKGSTMTEKSQKQLRNSFDAYVKIIEYYYNMLSSDQFDQDQKKFLKYRINSLYFPLLYYEIDPRYKKETLKKLNQNKIYYSTTYKYFIRLLKAFTILKKKISITTIKKRKQD